MVAASDGRGNRRCPARLDGFDLPTRAGGLLGQARTVEARSADLVRRCRDLHRAILRASVAKVAKHRGGAIFRGSAA